MACKGCGAGCCAASVKAQAASAAARGSRDFECMGTPVSEWYNGEGQGTGNRGQGSETDAGCAAIASSSSASWSAWRVEACSESESGKHCRLCRVWPL